MVLPLLYRPTAICHTTVKGAPRRGAAGGAVMYVARSTSGSGLWARLAEENCNDPNGVKILDTCQILTHCTLIDADWSWTANTEVAVQSACETATTTLRAYAIMRCVCACTQYIFSSIFLIYWTIGVNE